MKIAVWKTGHEIADTVAVALAEGLNAKIYSTALRPNDDVCIDNIKPYDAHLFYGVLRGTEWIGVYCDQEKIPYFILDRGYTNPGHFDGNYRISYRGTQFKWHEGIPRKPVDIKLEPMRYKGDYVLICPPTTTVCNLFGIDRDVWIINAWAQCGWTEYVMRDKGETFYNLESQLGDARAVITFNSSVGWQALQMGIPVLSDVNHSAIGSFYRCTDLSTLIDNLQNKPDNRLELFEAMESHQFKLSDTSGLWKLLDHYLTQSSSDMMQERPLPQMCVPIVSVREPNQTLVSHFLSTEN